ncbi:MAG: MbtH family protein [Leptolyngbyaceae cyanobacterium]
MTQSSSPEPTYRVVISDEERYSIWPEHKEIPWGWRADQKVGTKQDCLDYIKEVWTDMRPLSLRQKMAVTESQNTD